MMSDGDEAAPGPLLSGRGWAGLSSSLVGDLILATRPHTPELGCSLSSCGLLLNPGPTSGLPGVGGGGPRDG